jgi:predicted transcriptional regulator
MNLKEYFQKNRISIPDFAIKNKISSSSIYLYMRGQIPSYAQAVKIVNMTKGEVTLKDLLGEDYV